MQVNWPNLSVVEIIIWISTGKYTISVKICNDLGLNSNIFLYISEQHRFEISYNCKYVMRVVVQRAEKADRTQTQTQTV